MKKILLMVFIVSMLICAFAVTVNAVEIDYNEKATLTDGTVLPIYDENNNPLIWFIKDAEATGMDKYASVPNNRNTADNATSYVTYRINSQYGTNQLHDVYIKYWDSETSQYVDYGEDKVVIYNLRGVDTIWCVGSYSSSASLEYVYMPSSCRDAGTYNGYPKLQLIDFSLATDYSCFGQQAFKDCTALREVRFGISETGYELKSARWGCLFYGCTNLTTLKFADISKITAIEGGTFENCYSLTGTYDFSGVTSIGSKAFYKAGTNDGTYLVLKFPNLVTLGGSENDTHVFGQSGVQELYFGNDIITMKYHTFTGAKKLWKVEFAGITQGFNFTSHTFEDCSALKAFSIPEGVTALPNRMFKGCTSLKAVYIPSTVTAINSGAQDNSTFANCTNLYFVDKPFTFTGDSDIPVKPDIYYFPSGITVLSGETFKNCQSLNKTLVFGEGVTEITNAWAFEAGVDNPTLENIVFLGNMTSINSTSWKLTGSIYFCNSNDISNADVSISGQKAIVFCNAQDNTTHLIEKTVEITASCDVNKAVATYCFCGYETKAEVEGTALSHDYDYENGNAIFVSISYTSYCEDGTKVICCANCGENGNLVANALFTCLGYSAPEDGRGGIAIGYTVNNEAITEYETITGKTLKYGVFAVAKDKLGTNDVFAEDGTVASNTIAVEISNHGFVAFELKIIGFTDEYKDLKLAMGAYVAVTDGETTEYSYMQSGTPNDSEKYCFVSYNDIVGKPSTEEEVTQ